MQKDEIYGLTPQGEQELRSSATTLSADELELLVRIDATVTLAQLRAAVPAGSADSFERTLERLRSKGLIEPVHLDNFAMQLEAELANFAQAVKNASPSNSAEAEAGLRSLKRAGYYVGIARKQARAVPPAPGQPLTAVVVEDDPNLARFVSSFLAFGGFSVRTASNRDEVLAEFRKPPVPNLVVLDVMLPDVNGFDVLASIRRHPALRNVPVIMLTGKATRESVLQGLAGGADGYITKPFEPEALMAAVRTVLGLPEPPAGVGR